MMRLAYIWLMNYAKWLGIIQISIMFPVCQVRMPPHSIKQDVRWKLHWSRILIWLVGAYFYAGIRIWLKPPEKKAYLAKAAINDIYADAFLAADAKALEISQGPVGLEES